MIPMTKEALEQLRTTIVVQQQAINALEKKASEKQTKAASTMTRPVAAELVDTLVARGEIPAVSRTNIMEKLAADHSEALQAFLGYVNEHSAPASLGGVDKSASFNVATDTKWGNAGATFEAAMGR